MHDAVLWWGIVLPTLLGATFYVGAVACMWPRARPLAPLWLLVATLLFPPLFPFVFFYVLWFTWIAPPPVLVLVEPPSVTTRAAGRRV